MPKPTSPTRWADTASTNRKAIDTGLRDVGFPAGALIPAGENNQRDFEVGEWLGWADDFMLYDAHCYLFLPTADQLIITGSPTPTSTNGTDTVDISFGGNGSIAYRFTRVVVAGETAKLRFDWGAKAGSENIGVTWSLVRPTSATNPFGSVFGDNGSFTITAGSGDQDEDIDAAVSPGIYLLAVTFTITGSTGTNSLDDIRLALTYGTP